MRIAFLLQILQPIFKKKYWTSLGLGVMCLALVLVVFLHRPGQDLKKLEQVTREYESWKKNPKVDEQFSLLAEKILASPLLRYYYLGDLSEQLLFLGHTGAAEKYSNRLLGRASLELPFFIKYSSISFMIHKNELQQALGASYRLKKEMLYDSSFLQGQALSFLFAMNLFRIALLEKTLSNFPEEFSAWVILENYLGKASPFHTFIKKSVTKRIQGMFQSNDQVFLKDFISFRKNEVAQLTKLSKTLP